LPRAGYRGRGFEVHPALDDSSLTSTLREALNVAETQGFEPSGGDGCIWAAVDISLRQIAESVELDLSIAVNWSDRTTIWGSERLKSTSQKKLRDDVLRIWYPDLHLRKATGTQPSWSPQDFYEAACVPDNKSLGTEISSMKIPRLEATLYPFQCRAVQWLLRREGVQWHRDPQSSEMGIQPYIPPASSEAPISFGHAKDADGNAIYVSPLLGAATRDTAVFQSLQQFRGGILAEEMGLGKTLEVIALILLHPRPECPIMVFDAFLGRELLATSATLIVAPSSLLDQWLSELSRHAPGLAVMFYPGIKKMEDGDELSAEHLAQQDVVVTTYEVLRTEIWAASDEPTRSMRNERQYERRKSPLVQLSWWRVCIDEAQMVENWTNNAAQLARRIPRINAWGVTGTPVKDDVQKGKNITLVLPLSCADMQFQISAVYFSSSATNLMRQTRRFGTS
jgi:E3 ubiquitin-protein ligase SHPRH